MITRTDLVRHARLLERLIAVKRIEAGELLPFVTLTMPSPNDFDDVNLSLYQAAAVHRALAEPLQRVAAGTLKRLIVSLPPRTGKTEMAAKRFIPFYVGHNPLHSVIFGTYNDKFSMDIGRAVRDVIQHPACGQAFPNLVLKNDSAAADRLETTLGGVLAFVGRAGTVTGRGADCFICDDLLKDAAEADSPTIRDNAWEWFNRVAATRLMTDRGAIVIIGTRWHPDDLIGRLTDPANDYYNAEEAAQWEFLDLPALARDNDPLGRKEGEALWPERFGREFLLSIQRRDPRGFSALYQGRPNPASGTFFEDKWLKTYQPNELPQNLRIYASSDHAVSLVKGSDKTCLIVVGVDEQDNIWVLPDTIWRNVNAEQAVEAMLVLIRRHKPLLWWAERGHISKSLGPFLRKRMLEEQVYCTIVEVQPIRDKQTRAQSIQGRMASGKVRFPARAHWWPAAREEILAFPHGAHDDFCLDGDTPVLMADGQERPLRDVRVGQLVHTPDGPHPVLFAGQTQSSAAVLRVRLSNGRELVGTASHPVWVLGEGFVRMDALAYNDTLWHSAERPKLKWSNIWGTVTGAIQAASGALSPSTSTQLSRVGAFCTAICGRTISVLSRQVMMSTTGTGTAGITISATWSAYPSPSIGGITSAFEARPRNIWPTWRPSALLRKHGTLPKKDESGTGSTRNRTGSAGHRLLSLVSAVARASRRLFPRKQSSAIRTAVRVMSVEALTTPQPVYNLAVHQSRFFAAGVLTHNCDALSYIGLGMMSQTVPRNLRPASATKPFTFGWLKAQRAAADNEARAARAGGW